MAVANYEEGVRKLLGGEVAAMVADMPACAFALLRHPDAGRGGGGGAAGEGGGGRRRAAGGAGGAANCGGRRGGGGGAGGGGGGGPRPGLSGKWFDDDEWLSLLP
ncbi:MAG: hypothetical protein IPO20_01445 [Gammaproteobacteria bacterium]|nr:hypothetical protein [Gammaproteobacteria bacterium]